MTNTLQYLPMSDVVRAIVDDVAPRNPYVQGYGPKIPTHYRLVMTDGYTRRVYAMCYGNASTLYVNVKGEMRVLSIDVEYALRDGA